MSILSKKLAQSSITFNTETGECAIVAKDRDAFPSGFKYVFRPNSKHANMIRNHFVDSTGGEVDLERLANDAYHSFRSQSDKSGLIFLGINAVNPKRIATLCLAESKNPSQIINLVEKGYPTLEIFIKRQLVNKDEGFDAVNIDIVSRSARRFLSTGESEDLDFDTIREQLEGIEKPTLVFMTHWKIRNERASLFEHYRTGHDLEVYRFASSYYQNPELHFFINTDVIGGTDFTIESTGNPGENVLKRGLDTTVFQAPSDYITIPDPDSYDRFL